MIFNIPSTRRQLEIVHPVGDVPCEMQNEQRPCLRKTTHVLDNQADTVSLSGYRLPKPRDAYHNFVEHVLLSIGNKNGGGVGRQPPRVPRSNGDVICGEHVGILRSEDLVQISPILTPSIEGIHPGFMEICIPSTSHQQSTNSKSSQ